MLFHSKHARTRSTPFWSAAIAAAGGVLVAWARRARRRRRHAARLHRSMIDVLLAVLSAGDAASARHSRRVADLTDALAESAGLRGPRRRTLRIAALLHDMGKVDEEFFDIVHGRTPLSSAQRERIEHHPHRSAHLLKPLEWAHAGLTGIVASHHERWDGNGYPLGCRGREIPLEARIIALADAFDAMTQTRSYREEGNVERAFEEITAAAGRQFDPALVARLGTDRVRRRWRRIARRGHTEERLAQRARASAS